MTDIVLSEEEFNRRMEDAILERRPEGCRVEFADRRCNNGIAQPVARFRMEGRAMSPAVALSGLFEKYLRGSSVEELAEAVVRTAMEGLPDQDPDPGFLADFKKVRKRLGMRLVNAGRNRDILETIPWIPLEDLAVTFYVLMPGPASGGGMVQVRDREAENWQVSAGDLYREALKNCPVILPPVCRKLSDFLGYQLEEEEDAMRMLTNERQWYGAAAMLYPGFLASEAGRLGDDLYILPSSVHEVMLLPASDEDPAALAGIVSLANRSDVAEEEFLSDSVYLYRRKEDRIVRAFPPGKSGH